MILAQTTESQSGNAPTLKHSPSRRGSFIQIFTPRGHEWNTYELGIPNLPGVLEGFRIVHISDMHFHAWWSPVYDQLIERINSAQADLLLFTGDFNERKLDPGPAQPSIRRFVEPLKAKYGRYAIVGNHDVELARPFLPSLGLTMMDERREMVADLPIELIGLPGTDRIDLNLAWLASLPRKSPELLRIVMSHYPDHLKRTALSADLFLAGHTHGGQICLPGGRPILTHDTLPRQMCKGVHRVGDTWLIVSRGIGFATIPVRLFCPPELIEIRLVRS